MKLLLDQDIFQAVAPLLRARGVDAVHTSEIGWERAEDAAILQRAHDEGRWIVTHDGDYHLLLAHSGGAAPTVIRIREDLETEPLARLIEHLLATYPRELESGVAVSATSLRVRMRRLPLDEDDDE